MNRVEWLQATLEEAWAGLTPLLIAGFFAAAAVRSRASRETRSRASLRGTFAFLLIHVLLLPVLGYLKSAGYASYESWRMASVTVAAFAGISILLVLVFDGVVRWLKIDLPRIVSDVGMGAAYFVGGMFLLSAWGVNLSGLIATSAVLTAVIGFSLQDTLGNLMSGMALQLERSIKPGDWIQIDDDIGRVVEIRWRKTAIETREWETIVVPNSFLAKNKFAVLGRRQGQPIQWRRWVYFHIDYRHEPTEVIKTVEETLRRAPMRGVALEPKPECVLTDMRDSYCTYGARYWLTDLRRIDPTDSLVRTRVFFALRRANIPLTMPAHALFLTEMSEARKERKARDVSRTRETALRHLDLFGRLSDEELAELAAGLRFSPFTAGELLTRQGSEGHDLYLIAEGQVGVRVAGAGGEKEIATLGPGDFFGERSLMTGDARSATTVALTDVVCYRLPKERLQEVLRRRPALAEELAEVLAQRQSELDVHRRRLDAEQKRGRIEREKSQLLGKIKSFFGL